MNRTEKRVLAGTVLVVLLTILLEALAPREVDWTESYTRYKRDPYACGLVYDRLVDLFPKGVKTVHDPVYLTAQERLNDDSARHVNHVFVDRAFHLDKLDMDNLLEMVRRGDNALIAAEEFNGGILDTLHAETGYHWQMPDSAALANLGFGAVLKGDSITMRYTCHPLNDGKPALYTRGAGDTYFSRISIDSTRVLAENARRDAVLIRVRFGDGFFYLCSTPRVFTNYNLLREDTRTFMSNAFSFLPDAPVLWDEFYKTGRLESATPMRFILSKRPLRWAYWTVLVLLALYIFAYAKRRQRAVPVVPPVRNTSREFAETIGRLYYFKGDHADLARKMGAQFKDFLRDRLYLRRAAWDAETFTYMAKRTGIAEEEWQHAFRLIDHYDGMPNVSEEQLLQLNRTLGGLKNRIDVG